MATYRKRGKGWYVEIRRRGYPARYATFDSKTSAKAWAEEVESQMRRGRYSDMREAERTTVKEALERYAQEISINKKGWRQEANRTAMIGKDKIGAFSMINLTSSDVADYRNRRLQQVSAGTVNNELAIISHLYKVACREWKMPNLENPVAGIGRPKLPQGRDRRISADEEQKLLRAMRNHEARAAFILMIETGMRRGEAVSLLWADINGNVARLRDTKNPKNPTSRDVPLSSRALKTLNDLPRRIDGRVFGISADWLSHCFQAAAQACGFKNIRLHDIRHEATSRLFERGFDIMEVGTITGHKTLTMLKRYTHLKAENLAKRLG